MADFELTPVLIAQAWQITLLIVAVAAINRWVGKSRPHLAHALWLVVLVKCVTPPIWSSPSGLFCWLQPTRETIREVLVFEPPSRTWDELDAVARHSQYKFVVRRENVLVESDAEPEESLIGLGEVSNPVAEVSSITTDKVDWPRVLLGAWGSASLGVLGVAIVRWLRCWRMLRSAPQRDCAELSEQLDSLAKRLKLRRRVRLIVTESRLGPAVIGLFRTTVLLPALIVDRLAQRSPVAPRQESRTSLDSNSPREFTSQRRDGSPVAERQGYVRQGYESLVPILAHELLHIRRGDLWVGLLQTLAQAVWWCHPLVWWVNRRTTREAERCCDEEVLAELGCDPAAYARALIDVLELKRELKPVPVFPGVRPVEVTSQRLERIMQLGQGCQRRTPWWCWLLAGLAAAATWPGAAFVVTAEDPDARGGVSPPVISPQPPNRGTDAAPLANTSDGAIYLRNEPHVGLVYRVRVISGSKEEVQQLARRINEKLITKSGTPVVVTNDEIQRLLKEAQGVARLNTMTHPIATSRGGESAIVADTARFTVPVEVTPGEETAQYFETSREYGWRLTMQPLSIGDESLRLRVVNWQGRLDNDEAVMVRYRTTGEEKLIPGLTERQTSTTIELIDGQHVVFPVTEVPNAVSQDIMLLIMQVRQTFLGKVPLQPEPTPMVVSGPGNQRRVGVNSNSGVIGQLVSEQAGEAPAAHLDAVPAKMTERQILLSFNIYDVDEDGLKELGIKLGRSKTTWDGLKARLVAQFHVDRDVIAKLSVMEREQRINVLSSPTIMTLDGRTSSFLSGGEFPVPAIVGVGEAKGTATSFRGFGLQLTATPTIVGPDTLRVSLTMSDSKVADEPTGGATTVAPTLISQSIQSELLMKSKQPVFFGPLGEPGAKGKQRIATLLAEIVEAEQNLPLSGEKAKAAVHPAERREKYALKSQPSMIIPSPEKLVTVNFENVPLKAAMKQLAQSTGRNIVLEKPGLEEEGLTEREPVTLSVDDVRLASALTLLLDPLKLGYRVEESGVIVVTSKERLKGKPVVVTYPVSDLLPLIPRRMTVNLTADQGVVAEASKPGEPANSMMQQLRELVDLITSTCQPDSWEEVAGNGSCKVNATTLSLVVRQTQDVQREIRGLLEGLRRQLDLQAALHVERLTVPADFWSKVGKDFDPPETEGQPDSPPQDKSAPRRLARLTKKEAALLRSLSKIESAPKVTLFSGQELDIHFGGKPPLRLGLKPVVTSDRTALRVQAVAVDPAVSFDLSDIAVVRLESGHSLLLDATELSPTVPVPQISILDQLLNPARSLQPNFNEQNSAKPDHRTLLLITGQVVIVEEEEEEVR